MKSLRLLALISVLLGGCAVSRVPADVIAELAPTGTLRVAANHGNFLLVNPGSTFGSPSGIAPDIGAELAHRMNVPIVYVSFPSAGATADAVKQGVWDIAFLGAEPQRANEITFTAAYLEIPVTYLVPPGSKFRNVSDVDQPGVRIAVSAKSAYDLYLSRTLKHAKLERAPSIPASFELFRDGKFDALVGLQTGLLDNAEKMPGSRVLEGQITTVQQSIGVPKGRERAAIYLRRFVEEIKRSGYVAQEIAKHRVRGVSVAPAVVGD
jgi:polar amino acid transport system substrate-binding protein